MKITIQDLKQLCELLLDKVKNVEGENIVFDQDLYWEIISQKQLSGKQPEYGVGSLSDSIESLQEILSGEKTPNAVDLKWLGQLLISLGEKIEKNPEATKFYF